MSWVKQERIFHLEDNPCRTNHAQVPTPYVMSDGNIRVYYACRDTHNQSYPAYFDLSRDLKTVLRVHETSVMERSEPGMFDSNGVMPSCIITNGDELWMYYIGWNALRGDGARYHNVIGLAISKDGGETFERVFDGPIMDRTPIEPGICVMPFIIRDGDKFKCWYQSGIGWHKIGEQYEPTYVIKYAESDNGIDWKRFSNVCVKPYDEYQAQSRPCVVTDNDGYGMWYCSRGSKGYRDGDQGYRIYYAHSHNGTYFEKEALSEPRNNDWDSQQQCYPYVINIDDKLVMFYNGNGFGQTGIGLAIWE